MEERPALGLHPALTMPQSCAEQDAHRLHRDGCQPGPQSFART